MLDTVTIKTENFVLLNNQYFKKVSTKDIRGDKGIIAKYKTKICDYEEKGKYFPNVQIQHEQRFVKGGSSKKRYLIVQCSIPKLLYNTNLFDVTEEMLELFCFVLQYTLKNVGVHISSMNIAKSFVTRVDFSKIIKTSHTYGNSHNIIQRLSNYNFKPRSDFNKNSFHNGKQGAYIKFFNQNQGFVIYDKYDEICSNPKTNGDLEIIREYKSNSKKMGALRIEVALHNRTAIKQRLSKYLNNKDESIRLRDVFDEKISKKILLATYEGVYMNGFNDLTYLANLKELEIYQILKKQTSNIKDLSLIYFLARRVNMIGLKETLDELKKVTSSATFNRYKKLIRQTLSTIKKKQDKANVVQYIHRKLKRFTYVYPQALKNIYKNL